MRCNQQSLANYLGFERSSVNRFVNGEAISWGRKRLLAYVEAVERKCSLLHLIEHRELDDADAALGTSEQWLEIHTRQLRTLRDPRHFPAPSGLGPMLSKRLPPLERVSIQVLMSVWPDL